MEMTATWNRVTSYKVPCPVCKGDKVGPFVKSDTIKCKICGGRGRLASPETWISLGNELGGLND